MWKVGGEGELRVGKVGGEGEDVCVEGGRRGGRCVWGRWEERGKMCVGKVGGEGEGGRRVSRDT